ncbi:zinc-dependent alcohol dehydrogenase family protein [Testudinibacter sp. TR-2022]|uniref:zinc-dependent alcohol dehydrogenase family protein n=1 Tax=Testudinibacter sp. TR-2022 TaxID=2585029 RepID=UPI00111B0689|nr:zinc-dependent alcohol dehydrogenase family protein [Testudinibacter sp. TR-2022]TNH04373.1 zinc-binding dehydrogenase [Pasteurellaceae bacterium Phil11]TNH23166.1 zinc-binding dehydrogenase [Testudinibacter sp. TR-2022]TNH23658.1 zinc-binding dehydrogenase [Testudinibacter sp. TR-2022]
MSKKVIFNQTGDAGVLEIIDVTVAAPQANEVQIKVQAIGLNRAEIMYRNGQYVIDPVFPAQLGYEAAGVVSAVGESVADVAIGDKVAVVPSFMFTEYGTYGETVNLPAHAIVKFPGNINFQQAAASYMQYVTAYGALIELGKLKQGDVVLINAAASSVGIAAIQIAKMIGAVAVAVIRNSSKKQALLDAGADYVLTAEQDLLAEVSAISGGKGANMVFDPVGGANAAQFAKAMAMQGMYFIYGALDYANLEIGVMDILAKHLTFRGYELFEITTDSAALAQAKAFVNQGLASGALSPVIDREFEFDHIRDAHRYMESGTQIGKIVVNVS